MLNNALYVLDTDSNTNQTEILDVSKLANGSYIVRFVTANQVINEIIQVIRK
jgi:predicted nucleic acid-binding protein